MSQSDFAAALLDAKAPVPEGVIDPQGRPAGKRFDVYRNNVIVSLSKALAAAYPVVEKLVGGAFFGAMANVYVRANPPQTPVMIHYGGTFPEWLASFPPAASLPYLPDIARLERARRRAYHAADSTVMPAERLGQIAEDTLPGARLAFLPAMEIVASPWPIFSIWQKNMLDPALALPQSSQTVLVSRPEAELEMRVITDDFAAFITRLRSATLGDALGAMGAEFDAAAALGGILSARLLTSVTPDAAQPAEQRE